MLFKFTHPDVVPNLYVFLSFLKHTKKLFLKKKKKVVHTVKVSGVQTTLDKDKNSYNILQNSFFCDLQKSYMFVKT